MFWAKIREGEAETAAERVDDAVNVSVAVGCFDTVAVPAQMRRWKNVVGKENLKKMLPTHWLDTFFFGKNNKVIRRCKKTKKKQALEENVPHSTQMPTQFDVPKQKKTIAVVLFFPLSPLFA